MKRSVAAFCAVFLAVVQVAGSPKKVDVVVVGAGLSGLATAYYLKKAGLSYEILEATPRVGGRVRTMTYTWPGFEGVRADSGMEEYWESNKAVEFLKELKLPLRSDVALSSIFLQSKLEPLVTVDERALSSDDPDTFFKRIFTADERKSLENFKTTVSPLLTEIKSGKISESTMKLKDVAFSKWVEDQKVPKRVAEWIRISLECEIGTQWERISALDGIAEFHIFMGKGEKSYRVVGGNEKWVTALADRIGQDKILLNKKVNRIVSHDKTVSVYYTDMGKNKNEVIEAGDVVTTIPLYRFFEVQFEPELSAKKQRAITSQGWGAYFKAHVFVSAKAKKYWTLKNKSFLPILSDSNLGVIYDGNPDQKGKAKILSLLITGNYAELFNMMPQDQVRSQILASFEKLWPGFTKEIKTMEFYRYHPRAIASWPVGRSRYDDLSNELRKPENHVHLAGDFTESSHSDGAFISAQRVADEIIADKHPKVAKAQ